MTKEQEALVTNNAGLAYHIARNKYRCCGIETEDVEGIALLALVKAAKTFNPGKGISFCTYAGACIDNAILMELRRRRCREGRVSLTSLQEVICKNGEHVGILADVIADPRDGHKQVEDREFLKQLMRSGIFSDRDKLILKLVFLDGCGQTRVGKYVGVSQSYVSRLIRVASEQARRWATK